MFILIKKLTSDSFLRKALYIVAIVGIVIVVLKVVWGNISTTTYIKNTDLYRNAIKFEVE
ncbi:MAG: hypothetical protein A2249_00675 [Candidatus Jacksonbacteria bacterium RIFOXYA2_FULL_44_7]|uniref:Uncharacterized protein n=1 Tax=Candidatus Jacksonbacteria bacterium RIFCSPLOWO2_02_FULL_44_20 TaxID=1798460 RepID=A0A1G2A5X5_9BACT|nr:MAG: hypothetical protein UW39_C0025G0014 [Parcubacteria group bacterium GW2011_GWC2_44_17]KKT48999.1 MAG: hypothetical protein UW40_C0028G0012 [Parcubacteria group bacterium GW2011_GWF2_44_17]OGY69836.1 MAG: hypothetical protein A3C00_04475 [Candidatus Jacksonbacteria bacterium RIFCSPHIGHO2_02_FULL_44_25]OGY72106.1 MAG: hypothetical protein A3E05_03250 [Candidatus Jacksonbacteria bacterium RIFCSPHIGHO2_12_FULL_44_12]OGY72242.1 MAG: hypothetical protein A3H61_04500 [Candidatus Jacksonbacteri